MSVVEPESTIPDAWLPEQYLDALKRIEESTPTIAVEMSPAQSLVVVGALQLALRHPSFPRSSNEIVVSFVRGIQNGMKEREPLLAHVIEIGFDPGYDGR